jgi:hypothetical protein
LGRLSLRQSDNFFAIAPAPICEHEIGQMLLYKGRSQTKKQTQEHKADEAGAIVSSSTQAE